MDTQESRLFDTPFQGLLATPSSPLPYQANIRLRSFVLRRPAGNVVVYNSPGVSATADSIRALGTPTRLLVTHAHEAMYGRPALDVPIWMHQADRPAVGDALDIAGTFDQAATIDDDLQVIPTPGHTAGTCSYVWDNGRHRFLFSGDFIWVEKGQWQAVVLDPQLRSQYLDSLELVRDLDFDVLVPWGVTEGDSPMFAVRDAADRERRITAMIARLEAGASR
jgi:glyoxylase-like metal-dependent hydrolase (beta-lactamase superfamily II)